MTLRIICILIITLWLSPVTTALAYANDASTLPSVQKSLDARKKAFSLKADDAKKSDYENGIALIQASGVLDGAKQGGDKAPNFTLPNASGESIELYNMLKSGPVILVWYRGGWCPYCNIYLQHLQRAYPEFEKAGAQIIAISPELPNNTQATQKNNQLGFHVLSDVHNRVGKEYGVVYTLPDFIAKRYNQAFDMVKHNGDESAELPLSASYVISPNGVISYAFLDADYRNRAEPADLLTAVKNYQAAAQ